MKKRLNRMFVLILCLALMAQPLTAFGEETEEFPRDASAAVTEGDFSMEEMPDVMTELEKEEIREKTGAESTENIIDSIDITDSDIQAEMAEKEAYDKELDSYKVDDSDKLSDNEEDPSEDSFQIWPFSSDPVSDKLNYIIDGTGYFDTLDVAVEDAAKKGKPIYISNSTPVNIHGTVSIPKGKRVEIHLNGISLKGSDKLGSHEIFKVNKEATLRIYGTDSPGHETKISGGGDGAIVAASKATVELKHLTLTGNKAERNGGALYIDSDTDCRLNEVQFIENNAGNCGGALYANGSGSNIHVDRDTVFLRNTAKTGGAVYINSSKVSLYGPASGMTLMKENKAKDGYGGALYSDSSSFTANSIRFEGNTAANDGGAVYFNSSDCGLANCEIINNKARNGGGIYINGKTCGMSDVKIENNVATEQGGGVYVDSRYNLGTGGKVIVTNNHKDSSMSSTDLFLQEGNVTTAYLKASSYAKGSRIGIGVSKEKESRKISYAAGNYDPSVFYSNADSWYVAHEQDKNSSLYRYLILTKSKTTSHDADAELIYNRTDKKVQNWDSGKTYTADDGQEYPVMYGYASSPNHADEDVDIVNKYFYSDGYFFDDPKNYNPHLATFGMNVAMASANSNVSAHDDYSYKFDNIKSVLMGIGCEEESIYISPSYIVKPTDSSIGIAIGSKKIVSLEDSTEYTLIPIAVRSYGYEKEWASNMTINGDNTSAGHEHSGFRDARTKVMSAVGDYIAKNDLEQKVKDGKVKFFVTGFSRGSATANLTGAALVNTYGTLAKDCKPNDVFAYCFAVPAGATDLDDGSLSTSGTAYYCIHNIINKVDLTPMVGPEAMGFKRYGVDHYVPGDGAGTVKKIQKSAWEINGGQDITLFYDNNAYMTNSSAYADKRPAMLKQLMLVNEDIHFVDYFKESDIDVGLLQSTGQLIKGLFSYKEAEHVQINEVSNSTKTLEEWLPSFYSMVQRYDTLAADKTLTRENYSNIVVRAGKKASDLKNGEKNWRSKGATAQDTFRGLVMLMLSKTPSEKEELGLSLSGLKNKLGNSDKFWILEQLVDSKTGWDESESRQQNYLDKFWNMLNDNSYGQKALKDAITDKGELASLENYFPSILSIVLRLVRQDYRDSSHSGHMRLLGSFANNTEAILQGHVPEIALAWLRVNDDYYSNEKNSYAWGEETAPIYATLSMTMVGETEGIEAKGSRKATLSCSVPSAEIFYKIEGPEGESQTMLYRKGSEIEFAAPEIGQYDYKVTASICRSRVNEEGKVYWTKYLGEQGKDEKTFDVTVRPEDIKNVTLQYQRGDGAPSELKVLNVNYGGTVKISRSDFPDDASDSDWYFESFKVGDEIKTEDTFDLTVTGDVTVTAIFRPRITGISIKDSYYVQTLTPEVDPEPKPLEKTMPKTAVSYTLADGTTGEGTGSGTINLSWYRILDDGTEEKITKPDPVAEFSTEYKVRFEFTDNTLGIPMTNRIEMTEHDGSKEMLDKVSGKVTASVEFGRTSGEKMITACNALGLEVHVFAGTKEEVTERLNDVLPDAVAILSGSDGLSFSGLSVSWDYEDMPQIDYSTPQVFSIKGDIVDERIRYFSDHNWSDWDEDPENAGLSHFQVKAAVNLLSADSIAPPVPDPNGGKYEIGEAGVPFDEDGNLIVTLNDPNSGSDHVLMYSITDSEGAPVAEGVYDGGILLQKPETGQEAVYIVSLWCKKTDDSESESAHAERTFSLRTGAEKKILKVFTDDYNDPMTAEEMSQMTEDDYKIYRLAENEIIPVDAADLMDEDFAKDHRVAIWKAVAAPDPEIVISGNEENVVWYKMTAHDAYLRAMTAPVLKSITLRINAPKTGASLEKKPEQVSMTIGDREYEIDPESVMVTWISSSIDSGIAAANTQYSAAVMINASDLKQIVQNESGEGYHTADLGLKFFTGDNIRVCFNTDKDTEDVVITDYIAVPDDDRFMDFIAFDRTFDRTGKAMFNGVDVPEGMTAAWDGNVHDRYDRLVKPNLPQLVNAHADDENSISLPVVWTEDNEETYYDDDGSVIATINNGVAYDEMGFLYPKEALDGNDDLSLLVHGYCVIPEKYGYDKDDPNVQEIVDASGTVTEARYNFLYPVTVEGAPISEDPDILPIDTEYEPYQDVVVEFSAMPVHTEGANVDVYYMITEAPGEGEEAEYEDAIPCWYDENWEITVNENAHKLSATGDDIEFRRITGTDYLEKGARVTAAAVEDGCRISHISYSDFHFNNKPEPEIPDEVIGTLGNLSMPSGSNLESLIPSLPAGCTFDEEEDLKVARTGKNGDYIFISVIYNPDPETYRDAYVDACIELTPGIHNINVEGGVAMIVDPDNDAESWKFVTSAPAMSRIILAPDDAPEGKTFDKWVVFCETGEDIEYISSPDKTMISFDMPEGDVFAKAIFKEGDSPSYDPVESLTVDAATLELAKGDDAALKANVVYKSGAAERPEVRFTGYDEKVIAVSVKDDTATIKALSSGQTVIWVSCGQKSVCCTVSVGGEMLAFDIMGGHLTLTDGSVCDHGTVRRGETVILSADAPSNPAVKFKEWNISGARFDITKNPVTFRIYDDIDARAVFTDADGYEDPGDYPETNVKIKSLKVTEPDSKKAVSKAALRLNGMYEVVAHAVYRSETEKPAIMFRSSNTDVVKVRTIDDGAGTAHGILVGTSEGTATVTAYCGNRKSVIAVTVEGDDISAIMLSSDRLIEDSDHEGHYSLTLMTGEQELVDLIPGPAGCTADISATWKIDDGKVATVKNGLITAKTAIDSRTTVRVTVKSRPQGAKKWIVHEPVTIALRVIGSEKPKNVKTDKSYRLTLKGKQALNLNAASINKKNIVSEAVVETKIYGDEPAQIKWESTNEDIVTVEQDTTDRKKAVIKSVGIGTAYVTVTGSNTASPNVINRAVMTVTVTATAPSVSITGDSLGLLSDDGKSLTIKAGSYDRLYYNVSCEESIYPGNVSQPPAWSRSGGITVKNGIIYGKNPTREGRPAKVVLKSGNTRYILEVTVK